MNYRRPTEAVYHIITIIIIVIIMFSRAYNIVARRQLSGGAKNVLFRITIIIYLHRSHQV